MGDPTKADAICKAKGFTQATSFLLSEGPVGVAQCLADGTGCFVNEKASCSVVFVSVTCK
jgi:hypothetical protein